MPWSIRDKVSGLFEPGEYDMRVESVTHEKPKEEGKNATIRFTMQVIGGEYDGKKAFISAPLNAQYIGILAGYLAGSQMFDEDDQLEDDGDVLARQIDAKMANKVFKIDYAHGKPAKNGSIYPVMKFMGPVNNFS